MKEKNREKVIVYFWVVLAMVMLCMTFLFYIYEEEAKGILAAVNVFMMLFEAVREVE